MPRSVSIATAVLLVSTTLVSPLALAQPTPGPSAPVVLSEGPTRVDHGDDGFTIHDNGTFLAPAGNVVGVDQRVTAHPTDDQVNAGNYKEYGFIVHPPDNKRPEYLITVEYDRQVYQRQAILGNVAEACGAELHMRLVDADGTVVDAVDADCIDDIALEDGLESGSYTLEVFTSEKSFAPTPFETTIDVEYF